MFAVLNHVYLHPPFTHLVVGFVLHVLAVHLHYPVSRQQATVISRRAGLHFADELATFVALAVKVKTIAAIPFGEETEPGSQVGLHTSQQGRQRKKEKEKKGNVSQENTQVFAAPSLLIPGRTQLFTDRKILIVQHAARSANNPGSIS